MNNTNASKSYNVIQVLGRRVNYVAHTLSWAQASRLAQDTANFAKTDVMIELVSDEITDVTTIHPA